MEMVSKKIDFDANGDGDGDGDGVDDILATLASFSTICACRVLYCRDNSS